MYYHFTGYKGKCVGESDQRMARAGASETVVEVERETVEEGAGFEQSLTAHQHWHIDVSYIKHQRDLLLPLSWTAAADASPTGIFRSR